MKPKSGKIRNDWLQLDTLCCGMDWDEADLKKPQILVEDVGATATRAASIWTAWPGKSPSEFSRRAENRPASTEPTSATGGPCSTAG